MGDQQDAAGKPLRILCFAGWWPEPGSVAGIFIKEHALAIAGEHAVVVVFAEVVKGSGMRPIIHITHAAEDGLPVVRIRITTPLRRFGLSAFLVRRAYRRVVRSLHRAKPFSLIHVHVRTEETEQALTIADELTLPVVVTEHNSYYHLGIRALPTTEQRAQRQAITRWFAHPRIAAVMPVSNDLARVLRTDYGVAQEKLTVIPNVANAVFRPAAPPTTPPFQLVLSAVWRPPKDPDVFIDALKRLPLAMMTACRVHWTGYGPDMERIQRRCGIELGGWDIRFTGRLEKAELAALMRQAALFVLPTRADNLPCVVLESHCCGTPVLSMAVNGVPELIDSTNGILVPPQDPQALAEALTGCITHPDRFDRDAIARVALQRYSAQAVGARISVVYRQALRRSPANNSGYV